VFSFIRERPERVVLVYHNMSPSAPFEPWDPAFAGLLDGGRRELAAIRDRVTLALAPSRFSAQELVELGYRDVRVAPLVVDPAVLRATPPDPATTNHLDTMVEGPVVLYVGQLLPHKRPDFLLEAYHALVTYLLPAVNLIMVGAGRIHRYQHVVQTFAKELNLSRAWLTGSVTQQQLVSFFRRADLFVTASDHEGFCVPLVEAMAFGLPVIARAQTAVPEVLGDGGLLLPADGSPLLLAEAMATVLTDRAVRDELVERSARRLADFDPDTARATLLESLLDVA